MIRTALISAILLLTLSGCADAQRWSWLPWNWKKSDLAAVQSPAQSNRQAQLVSGAGSRPPYELIPPSLGLTQLYCEELLHVVRSFADMETDGKLAAVYRFGLAFGYAIGFVSGADATHQGEVEIPSSAEYVNFARDVATQCTQQPDLNLQMAVVRKFESNWIDRYYQDNAASDGQSRPKPGGTTRQQPQRGQLPPVSSLPRRPNPSTKVGGSAAVADSSGLAQGAYRTQSGAKYWSQVNPRAQQTGSTVVRK